MLKWFGRKKGEAKRNYRQFVKKGIAIGRRPELVGGCLIKFQGGCSAVKAMHRIELVKDIPYIAYIDKA